MIRELNRNNETDWNERIQLELNLADIQAIYDCVGAIPDHYLDVKHKLTAFGGRKKGYYGELLTDLYESLHVILCEHNGVTDDDMMVNPNVSVKVIGDDEE